MSLAWITAEDDRALAGVHAAAFDRPWDAAAFRALLAGPGVYGFRAEDGLILCRVVAGEMEVLTLAVAPAARRRGLAKALVGAALEAARSAGAQAAFLEVAEDNAPAAALYAGLGFRRSGLRRAYYRRAEGPPADALVMRLDLARRDA